jgi:hypothetical protein
VSGQAVDRAGNVTATQVTGINVDLTAPTVAYAGNTGAYEVDDIIDIHCLAQDGLSGIATSTCVDIAAPAYQYPLGDTIVSATAADRAGHTASASTAFTVAVTPGSLCGLTTRFVQGSARYVALSASQQTKVDQLLTTVCAKVATLAANATPPQKQMAITAYQRGVDSLVTLGWLTPSQGATLTTLASAL